MKRIFKLIKFTIKLVITAPIWFTILVLIMGYKGYNSQKELYQAAPQMVSFDQKIEDALNVFVQHNETIELGLTQDETNVMIINMLKETNPDYLSDDPNIDEFNKKYSNTVMGNFAGFKGMTTFFSEDTLEIEAGYDLQMGFFTYETTVFLRFKVEFRDGVYKLGLDEFALGNMPFAWMYGLGDWIVGLFVEGGVSSIIDEALPFGQFNGADRSVTFTKEELTQAVSSDDPEEQAMINAIFAFVENTGLSFNFGDKNAGLSIDLSRSVYTKSEYQLDGHITSNEDLIARFKSQTTSMFLSAFITNSDELYFDINEMSFNLLLDYYLKDMIDREVELNYGETTFKLRVKPLFANFVGDQIELTIVMELTSSKNSGMYRTAFTLVTTPLIDGKDLVFEMNSLVIGDDFAPDQNNFEAILSLFSNSSNVIRNQSIVIEDFATNFMVDGYKVSQVEVISGNFIRFTIQANDQNGQAIIDSLKNQIQDAIDEVFNQQLTDPAYDDIRAMANDYLSGAEIEEVLVEEILSLDLDDQLLIYQTFVDALDEVDLSNLIPNT